MGGRKNVHCRKIFLLDKGACIPYVHRHGRRRGPLGIIALLVCSQVPEMVMRHGVGLGHTRQRDGVLPNRDKWLDYFWWSDGIILYAFCKVCGGCSWEDWMVPLAHVKFIKSSPSSKWRASGKGQLCLWYPPRLQNAITESLQPDPMSDLGLYNPVHCFSRFVVGKPCPTLVLDNLALPLTVRLHLCGSPHVISVRMSRSVKPHSFVAMRSSV